MDLQGVDLVGLPINKCIADPLRSYNLISSLRQAVHCDIEFHGHNDSGCAIANALCALQAGATHIDTTVLGIGERNGITALGGLVARLYTLDPGLVKKYDLALLREIEELVSSKVGVGVPFNTPITGSAAFHHRAGVHTNAVLQNPTSYEAINPEDFGIGRSIDLAHRLVGWNAIRDRAATLGLALSETDLRAATTQIKALADERRITLDDVDGVLRSMVTVELS
jgi:homocitrate synthase